MRRSDVNLILPRIGVSLTGVILALHTKANDSMIEPFTYGSTNGHKVAIALEELGLPYEVRVVNVFAGEGQSAAFLALNPTGKIPVIRDRELDIAWFERVAARPAVARGVTIPFALPNPPPRKRA
jgi:glutathione S-transferase